MDVKMDIEIKKIPREFFVGKNNGIVLKDCASIALEANEQVTFVTSDNKEYDVCKKDWGFYATPSINGRLLTFGFHTVLVENPKNLQYIWLVEKGKEKAFEQYLKDENHRIIKWLSNTTKNSDRCICEDDNLKLIYHYTSAPPGEMPLEIKKEDYNRSLQKCQTCGHFLLAHNYNLENIYSGQYVETTYQNKLLENFKKITQLPQEKSDNYARVENIIYFCQKYFQDKKLSVLDVGSGLCVFLYLLSKKTNWALLALDPDPTQAQHAEKTCQIKSICCDFNMFQSNQKFDLITFNKVLEHVKNPIQFLSLSHNHLSQNGLIYIELPDGTMALKDSPLREEFSIEHYHAFSIQSIAILIEKSGFLPLSIERVREPSGKYTLRVFCRKHYS